MNAAGAWADAAASLGGDSVVAASTGAHLERRYAEPHRRYHRTSHVEAVLDDASVLADELGLGVDDRAVLTLAVCAHDVVYDARPGDDERASASWARAELARAGLSEQVIARVEYLVLTTLSHDVDVGDLVAAVLSDADLAILAADPQTYDEYAAAVRQEFAAVPEELWCAGREQVLRQLLQRDRLFVTDPGRRRWESAARANVERELSGLGG